MEPATDVKPTIVKNEPMEVEDFFVDEPLAETVDVKPNIAGIQENEEEIDILGMSDSEEAAAAAAAAAPMSSSNGSVGSSGNRNKQRVSFAHPAVSSSATIPSRPTRVAIPSNPNRIIKKPIKKYVKDANKKPMTFNTQDYNYQDDELFFKREDIQLPFEDVRPFEEGLELRPLGEQRYVVDAMAQAFQILQQEARRIQGQLRALNARSGRIRKQIDREEDAIARGEDPTEVPRSSKGLESEFFVPVKAPARSSSSRPLTSFRRKKKKVIRRKPAVNTGNSSNSAAASKSNSAAAANKPQPDTVEKEEPHDSDFE